MKKQLLLLGIAITMGIGCIGCGGNKDVANNDKVAETTTEELSTVDNEVTEVKPATKKTTEEKTTEATTEKVSENKKSEKSDKKSDSKSNKKSGATTQAAATQPANESKPVVTTTNSSTSNNTSANNTSQTTQASSKPQTTECQHNWVHVDAVMGERIVKPAVIAYWYCRDCQKYYISASDDPCGKANGSEADYVLEPPVRETYEVSPAYDYCSKCGIRK